MADALLKGNHETYADYMDPATVREAGGAKLLDAVKAVMARFKAGG